MLHQGICIVVLCRAINLYSSFLRGVTINLYGGVRNLLQESTGAV